MPIAYLPPPSPAIAGVERLPVEMADGAGIGREHVGCQFPSADIVERAEHSLRRALALQAAPDIGERRRAVAALTVAAGKAVFPLPATIMRRRVGCQVGEVMGAVIGGAAGQAIIGEDVKTGVLSEDRADAGRDLLDCDGLAAVRQQQAEIVK